MLLSTMLKSLNYKLKGVTVISMMLFKPQNKPECLPS